MFFLGREDNEAVKRWSEKVICIKHKSPMNWFDYLSIHFICFSPWGTPSVSVTDKISCEEIQCPAQLIVRPPGISRTIITNIFHPILLHRSDEHTKSWIPSHNKFQDTLCGLIVKLLVMQKRRKPEDRDSNSLPAPLLHWYSQRMILA